MISDDLALMFKMVFDKQELSAEQTLDLKRAFLSGAMSACKTIESGEASVERVHAEAVGRFVETLELHLDKLLKAKAA